MMVTYDTREESNQQLGIGLGCNGLIDVLIEPITPDNTTSGIGFIEASSFRSDATVRPTRKKRSFLRSSSGSVTELASWDSMVDQMGGSSGASSSWMMGNTWGWISSQMLNESGETGQHGTVQKTDTHRTVGLLATQTSKKNTYMLRCANLAREFFDSPQGESASGADGAEYGT